MKEEFKSLKDTASKWLSQMVEITITRNMMWQRLQSAVWISMAHKLKATTIKN